MIPLEAPWEGLSIELDLFFGSWEGLVIAEVEFPDEKTARAFARRNGSEKRVTFDGRYHNSWLSRHTRDDLEG